MSKIFNDFNDQFVLSRTSDRLPEGWSTRSRGSWTLASHTTLPVFDIRTAEGVCFGWLIGYPIDPEGWLVEGKEEVIFPSPWNANRLEDQLYSYGGRYVLALVTGEACRLYLDPCGSLAVVYSAQNRVVASTTSLIEWVEAREGTSIRPNEKGPANKPKLKPNYFYPAGLTHEPDIHRLLPNHYLDLEKWRSIRHWPESEIERVDYNSVEQQIETIAHELRKGIHSVARRHQLYLPLTSGKDSRMLLASATGCLDRVTFVTFDYRDKESSAIDARISGKLARSFGLNHTYVPIDSVPSEVEEDYLFRIGYDGNPGKARDFYQGCARHLDLGNAWPTGFAGEVGRAYFWVKDLNESNQEVPVRELIKRMWWVSVSDRAERAMEKWVAELQGVDPFLLHDLMYLEHRVGCWASPHFYGAAPFKLNIMPFCHRRILDAMLRLPVEYRWRQRMAQDVIKFAWPDLASVPFH